MQVIQKLYSDMLLELFDFLPIDKKEGHSAMTQHNFAYYHSDKINENIKCTTTLEIDFYSPMFTLIINYEGQPGYEVNDKYISTKSITNFLNKIEEEIISANINWPYMNELKQKEEDIHIIINKLVGIKESLQKDINMI